MTADSFDNLLSTVWWAFIGAGLAMVAFGGAGC